MAKPSTSASANVDFNIADLTNIIAGFATNDRNDLVFVIENGTEFDFDVNFRADHGHFHDDSNHGSRLSGLKFEEGGHPKASDYELSFQAAGAGCNVVLTLFCTAKNRFYFITGVTPVNKENYFKFSAMVPLVGDNNYSSNGFKTFTDDHFEFEISITGTSPSVCKVLIREI
ncbi:MAG: hypothetical protein IPJ82_07020 [Lewinellaceae bacterium]|nr:hypothetical protein [Lewinellaceae bacterium]